MVQLALELKKNDTLLRGTFFYENRAKNLARKTAYYLQNLQYYDLLYHQYDLLQSLITITM